MWIGSWPPSPRMPKMYFAFAGFQRLVLCPRCDCEASSSSSVIS